MERFPENFVAAMCTAPSAAPLHLLNTTIIPSNAKNGTWHVFSVPEPKALEIFLAALESFDCFGGPKISSHIGHQATATYISDAFGSTVPMDRTPWDGSGIGLCLQLGGRPSEGKILTLEEMRAYGITWRVLMHDNALQELLHPQRMMQQTS